MFTCATYLAILFVIVYVYIKWLFSYWKNRNVICLPATFPLGNLDSPFNPTEHINVSVKRVYDLAKSNGKIDGGYYFFVKPIYVPVDPELVRHIMSVDFNNFSDRGVYINEENDPLSANLFALPSQRWKVLRAKLTPTFTSGKMKSMFFIMVESANNMVKHINENCFSSTNNCSIDVKLTMANFTTDIIGSAAFGLDCNCFQDTNSAFLRYGTRVIKGDMMDRLRGMAGLLFPGISKMFNMRLFNKEVATFFTDLVRKTLEYREKNNIVRKDFLQLLIDMKNSEGNTITLDELSAQCFIFFVAGFETSSSAMTFALYEMALNREVQEKARDEITKVLRKHDGQITYDAIMEMKYLRQVIDETLRKYPALGLLNRKALSSYKIPGSDLVLEKGTSIFIPVYSLHHDPDYFPDPERFDPDRFSEEGKQNIKHFTYMPFGDGPRNCVGLRFGLLQASVGLCFLLRNYLFTMNPKTRVPIEVDPLSFITGSKHEILLNLEKIEQR